MPASTTSAAEDVHYDVKDGDDDLRISWKSQKLC